MPGSSADARIEFRIPAGAKNQIERAAAIQGRTVSDFAKEVLTRSARAVIEEHQTVQLSDRDRDIFLKMLDADAAPNAALTSAARKQRSRIVR